MEHMRKHRNIKLVRNEVRKNCLLSESNYHTIIFFLKIYLQQNEKNTDAYE